MEYKYLLQKQAGKKKIQEHRMARTNKNNK